MTDKSQEHQSLNIWLNTNQTHWYSCPWCYEGYDHVTCLGRRGASLPVLDGTLRCCWCCWPGWRRPTSSCPRPVFRSRLKYDQIFLRNIFPVPTFTFFVCGSGLIHPRSFDLVLRSLPRLHPRRWRCCHRCLRAWFQNHSWRTVRGPTMKLKQHNYLLYFALCDLTVKKYFSL